MKKLNNKIFKSIGAVVLAFSLFTVSCETTELELLDDPNKLNPNSADLDLLLNAMQIDFNEHFEQITQYGGGLARQRHLFGPLYPNAYSPSDVSFLWNNAYAGFLTDARTIIPIAEEQELYTHIGMVKIMEAYMMTSLVDMFGKVPYTEAAQGLVFPNPKLDEGKDVYMMSIDLLDEAIADLNKEESKAPITDYYYDGNESNWIKFANTLKIKLYLQTGSVADFNSKSNIEAIVASGDYIQSDDESFVFQYGNNFENPDTRHFEFSSNYDSNSVDYMSNDLMWRMTVEKGLVDPRTRYYFYRQSATNAENTVDKACFGALPPSHYVFGVTPFCSLSDGYWGRDHGDNGGTPPDEDKRTVWGVYPVGGKFDADNFVNVLNGTSEGLQGAGINPIMMDFYVDFMLAEAVLELGVSGDAEALLESGVTKSINKVMDFGSSVASADFVPSNDDVTAYVDYVMNDYSTASDKLEVVVKEHLIALFGNGIDAYNTYRRTGKPANMQPLRKDNANNMIRSFLYPASFVDRNSVVDQKPDVYQQVFWDTNPATGFVK